MSPPRNIVVLVADSLRWDSVHGGDGARLPYVSSHATEFAEARSAGCWTLPATASLFTGLLPHEHGADSQSRGLDPSVPTIAEAARAAGYATRQVTANVATTNIFGLHRGFDEVIRIWDEVPAKHKKLHEIVVLLGKPRLRKQIISTDYIRGKLSEDITAAKVWLQDTVEDVFDDARRTLARRDRNFLFLNLMECHFPYHTDDLFSPIGEGPIEKLQEIYGLYHTVNQTFMAKGHQVIGDATIARLKRRQRLSWERLAPHVDAFVKELHERQDTLIVFLSDHGDCFGEEGWVYHFSNVTDGGNRVPLYWLAPGQTTGSRVRTPVSTRDVYQGLLSEIGGPADFHLVREPEASRTVLESCWYNAHGTTLPKYKYNQLCFLHGQTRWLRRDGAWYSSPPSTLAGEQPFVQAAPGVDPVEELPAEERVQLRRLVSEFEAFSSRLPG